MNKNTLRDLIKEELSKVLIENNIRNKLIEKAKTKKDGIYSQEGIIYRVKNGVLTHYCKQGKVLEVNGYFDVPVGNYNTSIDARKLLKSFDA
jgi:hypothetical protein